MQISAFFGSPEALMPFWLMTVSMITAVLPVWRSPMISSRWPRPMGISASIAFRPVCIGSCTDLRGMMPGALTSTRRLSVDAIGPLPSIGLPRPSTTRPSRPGPTGTSTMVPVRETVSPSRIWRSSPKITTPTLSVSRFSAMPRRPAPGNSTISPDITFCRPNTRAMPSPTDRTWPVSATLASVSNAAICFFRISEISAGRISILGGSLHGVLQALQPGFQTGVIKAGPDPDDQAAEQVGIDLLIDVDVAVPGLDQAGAQLLALHVVERMRRGDMGGDDAAPFGHQGGEGVDDLPQHAQATIDGDDTDEVANFLAEAFLGQHGLGGGGSGLHVDQRRFEQAAEISTAIDQAAEILHLRYDRIKRMVLIGKGIERHGVAIGETAAGGDS